MPTQHNSLVMSGCHICRFVLLEAALAEDLELVTQQLVPTSPIPFKIRYPPI